MGISTMGKVMVAARIENQNDLALVDQGLRAPGQLRAVEVSNALVDTGATLLSLPGKLVRELGLTEQRRRTARTTAGTTTFRICGPVRLTVQDRQCIVEVAEIADDCPVLIGQVPLELLDLVVDPCGQRLIGNPEHGGEQMIEVF